MEIGVNLKNKTICVVFWAAFILLAEDQRVSPRLLNNNSLLYLLRENAVFFKPNNEKHESQSESIQTSKDELELAVNELKDICGQMMYMFSAEKEQILEVTNFEVSNDTDAQITMITKMLKTAVK